MPAPPANTVPNTTTFTLQNVVDSVNPTTDDLVDCFADADSAQFDPAYEGSKNQLYNFRNYGNKSTGTGVLTFSSLNPGSYKSAPNGIYPNYTASVQKATDGSGTGFEADIGMDALLANGRTVYVYSGFYTNVTGGSGYAVGDEITLRIPTMPAGDSVVDIVVEVVTVG